MSFNAEVFWHLVGGAVVLVSVFVGSLFMVAPHKIDGYYLSRGGSNSGSICVYAHWTWHQDELSFCTDDYQKALDFVSRANQEAVVK